MLSTLTYIILGGLIAYLAFSVGYLLLFSLAGRFFYRQAKAATPTQPPAIAVLVPAYREDGIILSTARHLEALHYPADRFDIYIIADSFQPETIEALRNYRVEVLEVSFEKSTKSKSLNEAFARITRAYDIALICDADNILAKNFLTRIAETFAAGARAVQGQRVAKNLDTSFALLDACSEGINNTIFRKGANALGLSSAVIGSGMAFEFNRIRDVMRQTKAVGGFDKIVQLRIVEANTRIEFVADALIFDEKVDSSQAFKQQRKRWVSSQFIYLRQFFGAALKQLMKGNMSYFNLAVLNNIVLPRAFLLALLPLATVAGFLVHPAWGLTGLGLMLGCFLALALAIPRELVNARLGAALMQLPKAVILMISTLFGIRKANKTFIHTVHTKTEVSNTLYKDHVN
jgi:cellulose synthase/poly-beta-1,6-N-acetylglucosamine synthase-like glycosyltransferase